MPQVHKVLNIDSCPSIIQQVQDRGGVRVQQMAYL